MLYFWLHIPWNDYGGQKKFIIATATVLKIKISQ